MNFDDYEQLPTPSVATNMMAGAMAGVLEHCIMYPMDSIKTRMQSLSPLTSGQTIISTFNEMVKKEGMTRPIRGMTAVVAGAGPAHAFYFATYEYCKEFLTKVSPQHNQINYVISAVTATLIHDAISNPTEVIKQRLQMYNSTYRTVIQCTTGVYKTEGLRAFYRSYMTQLVMNLPHQAIHFTTYEFFQNRLNRDRKYNPPVHVLAGGAAGATAAAFTTPLDVVKTLLNTQEVELGKTKGMVEAIKKIYRVAGPLGFFKGLYARVLYSMPATAICWSTYEFFKYALSSKSRDEYKSSVSGKSALLPKDLIAEKSRIDDTTAKITSNSVGSIGVGSVSGGIRYVLPTKNISAATDGTDLPTTTTIHELPSSGGTGIYNSLLHTTHSSTTDRTFDGRGCNT